MRMNYDLISHDEIYKKISNVKLPMKSLLLNIIQLDKNNIIVKEFIILPDKNKSIYDNSLQLELTYNFYI